MKVAFFNAQHEEEAVLREMLAGHELFFFPEPLSPESAWRAKECEVVSVFVGSQVSAAVMDALPALKCIATRSTGYDHIDVAHAKGKGIVVCTVPSYGSRTVAEFAFALILSLSRKVFKARLRLLEGARYAQDDLRGFDLYGKTLGVVGTGKIGRNVIGIAKAFGMQVFASDPRPDAAFAQAQGFSYVELPELLRRADVVTLHAPAMKETHHLINAGNIGQMKKGALLINTARGDLIETDAMVRALASGHLGGVGLDVLEDEQDLREEAELLSRAPEKLSDFKMLYENHLLMDHANAILTPHIAFDTDEAVREILATTAENIRSFVAGKPQNAVA
jgi:D-lactate dehydrogenase